MDKTDQYEHNFETCKYATQCYYEPDTGYREYSCSLMKALEDNKHNAYMCCPECCPLSFKYTITDT